MKYHKKKVLCLIDSLTGGGAQRQMVGLASCLKECGYDVILATYFDICFYSHELQTKEIKHIYLNKASNTKTRLWYISRYIHRIKPDIVISYLETPSICACIAKIFNRKFKLIVSERNTTLHTDIKERIRFNLFRLADYIVPNSYSQEHYIKHTFPFLSKNVATIPNFVDLNYFAPPVKHQEREIPEVMIAASIWPSKNTLGFIDAVDSLKAKGYRFHITWYGLNVKNKGYCDKCQEKIERLGLKEFIELKEKTNQIKDCYQNADYFCLPSFYEGTPNVICEAMACGLPVACSDVCDNSKYIIEGENGVLFNPKETSSTVAAFERLFALSDEGYSHHCQRSRELAVQKLSKDNFIKSYIKLIER